MDFPGLFDFDLMATSLANPHDVSYLSVQMSGFRLEPFLRLSRLFLESVLPVEQP